MAMNRALIGKVYDSVTATVDRNHALRFADAVGEDGALFHDPAAARAAGYDDQLATPTFVSTLEVAGLAQVIFDPDLGLDFSRVVHSQQSYRWERPIQVGDAVTATPRIAEITTLGKNEVLVVESELTDAAGKTVAIARGSMLARGTAGA